MPHKLQYLLAAWFVLQIAVPFTAPLQACDMADLLGTKPQHTTPVAHETSTMPTTTERQPDAHAFVSPFETSSVRASARSALVRPESLGVPFISVFELSSSPQVQQTVLRL